MRATKSILFLLVSFIGYGQLAGDYQSAGSVDLNDLTNWQVYNGSSWQSATTAPNGNTATGNSITILSGHQWSNANGVTIPAGITLIHQGTSGTFSQGAGNKISLNGTYIHNTLSAVAVILNGMIIGSSSYFIYRGHTLLVPAGSFSGRIYGNLSFESTAGEWTMSLGTGGSALTVNGSLNIGNNVTLTKGSFSGAMLLNGDISVNGKMSVNSFSTNVNTQLLIGDDGLLHIPATHSVTINGILDAGKGGINAEGMLQLNGKLVSRHADGLSLSGNFRTNANMNPGSNATVEYAGESEQRITSSIPYVNLSVAGTGYKIIDANITVSGQLQLLEHVKTFDHFITVEGSVQGSDTAYIYTNGKGGLRVNNISSLVLFPVGCSTYNPVVVEAATGYGWTVSVKDSIEHLYAPYNSNKAVTRTWKIVPSVADAGMANISFSYDDSDPAQRETGFVPTEDVLLWHLSDSNWMMATAAQTPTGTPSGKRTFVYNNCRFFSEFAIANLSGPLPVAFTSLKVVANNNDALISFRNENELAVIAYNIEHSMDGKIFHIVKEITPSKNNGSDASYEWLHKNVSAKNWYRVRAREISMQETLSRVFYMQLPVRNARLHVYSYENYISYHVKHMKAGAYELAVVNSSGAVIHKMKYDHPGGSMKGIIPLPFVLPGIYLIKIDGHEGRLSGKFMKH